MIEQKNLQFTTAHSLTDQSPQLPVNVTPLPRLLHRLLLRQMQMPLVSSTLHILHLCSRHLRSISVVVMVMLVDFVGRTFHFVYLGGGHFGAVGVVVMVVVVDLMRFSFDDAVGRRWGWGLGRRALVRERDDNGILECVRR